MSGKTVSSPLQQDFRFFRHPHPHHYRTPYGDTFPEGKQYEVPTFRKEKCSGLGACYRPGRLVATETHTIIVSPASCTVWSSVLTTSACSDSRPLSQIQISSPYQLSSAYPVVVTRRVASHDLNPSQTSRFATLSGQLFINALRFIR